MNLFEYLLFKYFFIIKHKIKESIYTCKTNTRVRTSFGSVIFTSYLLFIDWSKLTIKNIQLFESVQLGHRDQVKISGWDIKTFGLVSVHWV